MSPTEPPATPVLRRGPSQPPGSEYVRAHFYITRAAWEALGQLAQRRRASKGQLSRVAVDEFLAREVRP